MEKTKEQKSVTIFFKKLISIVFYIIISKFQESLKLLLLSSKEINAKNNEGEWCKIKLEDKRVFIYSMKTSIPPTHSQEIEASV